MGNDRGLFTFMTTVAGAALAVALFVPTSETEPGLTLGATPGPGSTASMSSMSSMSSNSWPACRLDTATLAADPLIVDSFPDIADPVAATSRLMGDAFDVASLDGVHAEIFRAMMSSRCVQDRALIQRLYDIFAWQGFLHLNGLGASGDPAWFDWKGEHEIMRKDRRRPAPWGSARHVPPDLGRAPGKGVRVLSEFTQPGSERLMQQYRKKDLVLWDQNRNPVYYEILINKDAFDYIRRRRLFNLRNLLKVTAGCEDAKKCQVVFGPGARTSSGPSQPVTGPIELKLAWKILDGDDIPDRFYRRMAWVKSRRHGWQKREVGLVGMHIARKPLSSSKWVWMTFEHVDNVDVDPRDVASEARKGRTLRPLFRDPTCQSCDVNKPDRSGKAPTQVERSNPIPIGAMALNGQVRSELARLGSVWQYYELVGTQYIHGDQPSVNNLANAVMETFDQHAMDYEHSCMGCHEKAGLPRENPKTGDIESFPGTADFSYLFEGAMYMR